MVRPLFRWMPGVLFSVAGLAAATPALPSSTLATDAVRGALVVPVQAVAPVKAVVAVKAVVPVKTAAPAAPAVVRTPAPTPAPAARVSTPSPTVNAAQVAQQRVAQQQAAQQQAAQQRAAQQQAAQQRVAEQNRAAAIAREAAAAPVARSVVRGRSAVVRATAYNSLSGQTDSSPFITATGTRTRPGVVALSRDLLRQFPYGSRVTIEDLSGRFNTMLRGRVFVVEDTMAARKTGSLDIWMSTRSEAINFGARQVRITAVR